MAAIPVSGVHRREVLTRGATMALEKGVPAETASCCPTCGGRGPGMGSKRTRLRRLLRRNALAALRARWLAVPAPPPGLCDDLRTCARASLVPNVTQRDRQQIPVEIAAQVPGFGALALMCELRSRYLKPPILITHVPQTVEQIVPVPKAVQSLPDVEALISHDWEV